MTSMNPPSSIQHAVATVVASPAPVLAVDACGILDIVRSQYRFEAPNRLLETALGALGASAGQPTQLHLVVFSQVNDEVQRNLEAEQRRLKEHTLTLRNTGCAVLSRTEVGAWNRAIQSIEDTLSSFPQTWIDSSHLVSPDPTCMSRAQVRLASNIAPAKRGSNNIGDCLIVEH